MLGSSAFYHRHIQTNIAKLQQRKDKYVHYRIEFLKQFCEPIQDKIKAIEAQIQKYKNMRDTQQEVIQSQPDIASLKTQIDSYKHTHEYFKSKLDQYEKKTIQLAQYNKDLAKQTERVGIWLKGEKSQANFELPQIVKPRLKTVHGHAENRQAQSKSFVLPSLQNSSLSEVHQSNSLSQVHQESPSSSKISKMSSKSKKITTISQKIQRVRLMHEIGKTQEEPKNGKVIEQVVDEHQEQHLQRKKQAQELRQRITKFNKTQALFNDCFETKKNSVQRSVSQLQSKLIKNRDQFLSTCQAVSSKDTRVAFEQFSKLTCQEILTLFISFVWLNKKLKAQFAQKRKLIMDFIGRLPKIQNY